METGKTLNKGQPTTSAPEIKPGGQNDVPGTPRGSSVSSADEKVVVSKKFLDDVQRALKKQQEDIGFLKSVADKKAVALYHQRHKEKLPSVVKIRVMDVLNKETGRTEEKVVMGWGRMLVNEVFERDKKWYEKQTVQLLYQDKTTETLSLVDFNRRFRHIVCTQAAVITDERTGMQSLRLIRQDTGEEIVIDATFVN